MLCCIVFALMAGFTQDLQVREVAIRVVAVTVMYQEKSMTAASLTAFGEGITHNSAVVDRTSPVLPLPVVGTEQLSFGSVQGCGQAVVTGQRAALTWAVALSPGDAPLELRTAERAGEPDSRQLVVRSLAFRERATASWHDAQFTQPTLGVK